MNSQIKKIYTCFENKCVLDSLKIMEKILQDTSISQNFDFILTKSRDNSINKLAKQYDPSCFTFAENLCYYKLDTNTNLFKYYITFEPFFCSCSFFLDKGNCAHFIAACLISKRLSDDTKEFVTVKARGRPKLTKGALKK